MTDLGEMGEQSRDFLKTLINGLIPISWVQPGQYS
jgi:hypothetical protein